MNDTDSVRVCQAGAVFDIESVNDTDSVRFCTRSESVFDIEVC